MPSPLADKIRAKYPGAYDDMQDADLEKAVLAKHPEYQDLVGKQDSGIASTLLTAGKRALFGEQPEDIAARKQRELAAGTPPQYAGMPYKGNDPRQEKSILPKFQQPETYLGGFTNSLYNDFVRPLGTPSGMLGSSMPEKLPPIDAEKQLGQAVSKAVSQGGKYEMPAAQKQLGPAQDIQLGADAGPIANGTGAPQELLHPNRMEPASEIIDSTPNGNAPPLHESIPQKPSETALPPPGSARPRDINAIAANTGSADQVLESREITKPIVNLVRNKGWDKTQSEIGTNIRVLGDITDGLDKNQLVAFGKAAEGIASDEEKQLLLSVPGMDKRLEDYRSLMDSIFKKADVAREGGLGYIEDYVTHVKKSPEDFKSALQDIFTFRQGADAAKALFEQPELAAEGTGEAAGIYGKGMGAVSDSPFTKMRTNSLDGLDYNVNKIGRMYIESMARDTYLRPAVEQATELVKGLPDSKLKELSEWYIKNVTRFDSSPQLNQAYKKFVRFMVDTTSRSMLGFNPHLQELHAMRLGPVYAELGAKYSAQGLGNLLKNPAVAYREVAEAGLMPGELMPFKFQTAGERANSILNFKSMVDFVDRSVAYNGFKQKLLDSGMAPADAMEQAIVDTKKATFVVDPSRATKMLNPEYSNVIGRLAAQYKAVPSKIAEWIVRTGMQYKENPAAAARATALLGTSAIVNKATGGSLFHMPTSLGDWSAASLNEMRKITTYAIRGDVDKAMEEAALWLTPAGKSMQRLFTP